MTLTFNFCKCRPTASNYSRHCPFGYALFFPAFGAIYRYGVHRTLGSWRKKYSSQDMTYYFLSLHSSVIFYCFSCLNRRLKVNLRYYSIDLLLKLSKSDSANPDKLFCCSLLARSLTKKHLFSLNSNYGFVLMPVLGSILSLTMGVLLVRICILISLNFHQGFLI